MTQNDTRASSFSFTVTNFDQKSPKMIANKIETTSILKFTELKHNLKAKNHLKNCPKNQSKIFQKKCKNKVQKIIRRVGQNIAPEIDPKVA
jgi:hypothetical protein